MTAQHVADYCRIHVPSFGRPEVIGHGVAYHYTTHFERIEALGKFLGVALSPDLDCRQQTIPSPPATEDPGVVFAYEDIEATKEEGFDCDIVRIEYVQGVRVAHEQERGLLAAPAPPTILILNSDITDFR